MLPLERLQRSNKIENLWIYILSLLKKREIYGWEIPSLIEKEFGFKPGKITPYRVLYRLEKTGFVKSKVEERRRIYQITEKGKEELKLAENFYKEILKKIK
jgi:DNA-binding PadR family transcriptional regulator